MLGLIAVTLFTMPVALGAGGLIYFWARHDHRICPRCGHGWGKFGAQAMESHGPARPPEGGDGGVGMRLRGSGVMRPWSIMLLVLGAVLLTIGIAEIELVVLALGLLAIAGGVVFHVRANEEREERRAAMIASLQMPVLQLAADRGGRLTVTEVAAALSWPLRRAEKVLHSLDDGWRVASEVTDEGVIVYEFRELLLGHGPTSDPLPSES